MENQEMPSCPLAQNSETAYNISMSTSSAPPVSKYLCLLEAAAQLLLEREPEAVSVQEIAERAGVAKGTFYLYFRDKTELRECLVTQKAHEIFLQTAKALREAKLPHLEQRLLFAVEYLIDTLVAQPALLKLIGKDLAAGIFNRKVNAQFAESQAQIVRTLLTGAEQDDIQLANPQATLFMIIELVGTSCYACVLEREPMSITELKPHLLAGVQGIMAAGIDKKPL